MKMDLPKRRSQQKRSRNFWRWLSILFSMTILIGIGLFFAHRHSELLAQFFNRYTDKYREQVHEWAQKKQTRLKTEIARFKPKHEPSPNDVHFQFYSELSNSEVNVQEDDEEERKENPIQKNKNPIAIEDTFNPEEITTEFKKSLSMK